MAPTVPSAAHSSTAIRRASADNDGLQKPVTGTCVQCTIKRSGAYVATEPVQPSRTVWHLALVEVDPLQPLAEHIFPGHGTDSTAKDAPAAASHGHTSHSASRTLPGDAAKAEPLVVRLSRAHPTSRSTYDRRDPTGRMKHTAPWP